MTKKARHNTPAFNDFKRYSNNSMSDLERNAFEKEMEKDSFLKDAYEGFLVMQKNEFENDLSDLDSKIYIRSRKSNRSFYYRIAASITLLIALTSFLYLYINPKMSDRANSTTLTESIENKDEQTEKPSIIAAPELETELIKPNLNKPPSAEKTKKSNVTPALPTNTDALNTETKNKEYEELIKEQDNEIISETTDFASSGIKMKENYIEQKRIRGKVLSSEDYQPVAGATVSVKGSKNATVTNMDGNFELSATADSDTSTTLQIDFIGMERQEILADAGNDVNIVLNPSEFSLNEVVTISKASRLKSNTKSDSETLEMKEAESTIGKNNFEKFITENQIFPQNEEGLKQAIIILTFKINENNRPINIKVLESPGKIYANEAIRLLKLSPDWIFSPENIAPVKTTIILTAE